jgi:hypothetical protein
MMRVYSGVRSTVSREALWTAVAPATAFWMYRSIKSVEHQKAAAAPPQSKALRAKAEQ